MLGQAEEEALALERGGANGIIVENFGTPPFPLAGCHRRPLPPRCGIGAVTRVRQATGLPVGINMLRNDPRSALAVAVATPMPYRGIYPGQCPLRGDGRR